MKKIYIIDGNSLINRAFYALPPLTNSRGEYVNAVYGFINCISRLLLKDKPEFMVVAFDHARKTFRNEIFENYKGTRKQTPMELGMQFDILKNVLSSMNIKMIEMAGIEADDIIGTVCRKSGVENVIITGDRDALQLVNKNTKVWLTQKGITEIKEVNEGNIVELYGLTPSQIIDFKALSGDSSDNIPGIAGIGEKTALNLLDKYKNIDNIYNNTDELTGKLKEKVESGKDSCYMSYKLATIKTDCDVNFDLAECECKFPFSSEVKKVFAHYEFASLLKREELFCDAKEEKISTEQEMVLVENFSSLKQILNGFNEPYFCFDAREDFKFCKNGTNYILKKENLLFDELANFELLVHGAILPILENDNILKILPDAKANMHKLNTESFGGFFDISLAQYIIAGGGSVFDDFAPSEYVQKHKELCAKLKENQQEKLYYEVELPLVTVLYNMENYGFKIEKAELQTLANQYSSELAELEKEFAKYCNGKIVNIKSPKQVAGLLFEDLGLSDKGNKKHSTNVDSLMALKDSHEVVPIILRHRKVAKLYSTYIEPYLKMVGTSSLIHTIFNQMQTSTGRLSSSEPNLQNIPVRSEEGRTLRKIFTSRFEDGKLISADYNQIELRLLANFSRDEKLLFDYSMGTDIHTLTASQIFGTKVEDVTGAQRRMAKAVNFGIIYGISGFGLSKNIDVPVWEAKKYIDVYFEKYPGVKAYLDGLVNSAKTLGYSLTLFGRRRYIPELASSNGLQKMLGERLAMNAPLQGSASDIIKVAMIRVYNRLKNENLKSKLILQIHDELIVDCDATEEEKVQKILVEEMQNVYMADVPLAVGIGSGKTWYDC